MGVYTGTIISVGLSLDQGRLYLDGISDTRKIREPQGEVIKAQRMEVCDISLSSRVQYGWSMETGRGKEWPEVCKACGFGSRKQFTQGWACCTTESGLVVMGGK